MCLILTSMSSSLCFTFLNICLALGSFLFFLIVNIFTYQSAVFDLPWAEIRSCLQYLGLWWFPWGIKSRSRASVTHTCYILCGCLFSYSWTFLLTLAILLIHGYFLDDDNCNKFDYWHALFPSNEGIGDKYQYK